MLNGDGISPENFGDLRDASVLLNIPEMKQKVYQFVLKNFLQIRCSSSFRSLPVAYLREVLSSSKLAVNRESDVLRMVVQWITDESQRRSELLELLQCVRLRQLGNGELLEMPEDRCGIFREDGRFFEGILETLKSRFLYQDGDLETRARRESDWPRDSTAGLLMIAAEQSGLQICEI